VDEHTAIAPSPTAEAKRFTEPCRTSLCCEQTRYDRFKIVGFAVDGPPLSDRQRPLAPRDARKIPSSLVCSRGGRITNDTHHGAIASRRVSVARLSSRFSRSSPFSRSRSLLLSVARCRTRGASSHPDPAALALVRDRARPHRFRDIQGRRLRKIRTHQQREPTR
jgi:hypothetical protein